MDLAYSVYEPENGSTSLPPLVLLHGLFGSKNNWSSLAASSAKELNRRIIIVDARNHGDSPHHDKMDYDSMAADLFQLLNKLKINSAYILGHSMGGRTAMVLALTQPEVVSSLIIEDVIPDTAVKHGRFLHTVQVMKQIPLDHPGSFVEAQKRAMPYLEKISANSAIRQLLLENLEEQGENLRWKCNLDSIERDIDILGLWPEEKLKGLQYNGPALFIGGERSGYISDGEFTDKELILKYFPLATTHVIPEAGHCVHSDQPHEFSRILKNHMETLEK